MTEHQHYLKNAVKKSLQALKNDLEMSLAGKGDSLGPTTLDVRQLSMTFDHTPTLVRRVYIQANDSSTMSSIGWVTNESINICMECMKTFSLFTRRHHCRSCGILVCSECCNKSAVLKDFEEFGKQRVCHQCNPKMSSVLKLHGNMTWGVSILDDVGIELQNEEHSRLSVVHTAAEGGEGGGEVSAQTAALSEEELEKERIAKITATRLSEDAEYIATAERALSTHPETIRVVPFPGFVIKTRRTGGDDNKVFINVFHHTCVKDEHMMLTFVPYDAAAAAAEGEVSTTADVTATPLVYAAVSASCTEDREGYVSLLYNVLVSSAYFERATVLEEEVHITHPTAVNKILQLVNRRYKDSLCEDAFVLPRVRSRYHGPAITRPAEFARADICVHFVPASLLACPSHTLGIADDASSVSSKSISPQKLQTAVLHENAAQKLRRISSGRAPLHSGTRSTSVSPTGAEDDDISIVSDITVASNLSSSEMGFLHKHRRFALSKSNAVRGEVVLGDEALRLNARRTMSLQSSEAIKEQSLSDPAVLVGHQIVLPYNKEMETSFAQTHTTPLIDPSYVFVIIDCAKNNLRKTEYKIANRVAGDSWVKLKRSKNKSGIDFRILRKVNLDSE